MIELLNVTLPIFLLIGIGFIAVRFGYVDTLHTAAMGSFVINFAYPALVFEAMLSKPIQDLFLPDYFIVYALVALICYALGFFYIHKIKKENMLKSALAGMGSAYSNSGFIGFSVLSLVIGPTEGAIFLAMNTIIENLLVLLPTMLIIESTGHRRIKRSIVVMAALKHLLATPLIIALILGILASLIGLKMPIMIDKALGMLANAAAPVAIFMIGANLFGIQLRPSLQWAIPITLIKLVLFPCLLFAGFQLVPHAVPANEIMAGVLMASCPMASTFAIIGAQYGEGKMSSGTILITTLLSFFSLSATLLVWHYCYAIVL